MELSEIKRFSAHPDRTTWTVLTPETKAFFFVGAEYCLSRGKGQLALANRVLALHNSDSKRSNMNGGRETDSEYWKLLRNHEEWIHKDNYKRNADICATFGGPTEAGQMKADQELISFTDNELLHDITELNPCCFDQELRLWAPKAPGGMEGILDWTEDQISGDSYVRWLRGTRPGVFQTRPYTMEWIRDRRVYPRALDNPKEAIDAEQQTLRRLMEKCKTVVIQLNMQFRRVHAHAALLLLNSADGKAYIFDPNGDHALFLAYHPQVLENLVQDLGLELEYLQTPDINLLLPATWSGMWSLLDHRVSYAYLRGARKKCMTALARRGYCHWICLYITMEVASGKDVLVVIANLVGMGPKERYRMFDSFIAYLITLLSLWKPETDEDL